MWNNARKVNFSHVQDAVLTFSRFEQEKLFGPGENLFALFILSSQDNAK
jgi:hypothetical protein